MALLPRLSPDVSACGQNYVTQVARSEGLNGLKQ